MIKGNAQEYGIFQIFHHSQHNVQTKVTNFSNEHRVYIAMQIMTSLYRKIVSSSSMHVWN